MFIDTPIEKYDNYFVKREDLACLPPGPPFAKVRGLYKRLEKLKSRGIKTVGYYDTSISMATWGISYFAKLLDMKSVVFYYDYKDKDHCRPGQKSIWKKYDAETHRIEKPNMQAIQTSIAKKRFEEMYPDGEFLIPGLQFTETIYEISDQVTKTFTDEHLGGTIVVCTGSGMMCAGIVSGVARMNVSQDIIGVLVHTKSADRMKKKIIGKSIASPFDLMNIKLNIVDYGYEYTQKETCEVPFPCCPWYDRKAYKYMIDNINTLKQPVVFWNIGSSYVYYDDLMKKSEKTT